VSDHIVGIDLGTSNSVVAVCDQLGTPRVLADDGGYKVQPSVVSFHPNGAVIVGAEAKQRKVLDPKNTVYSAKRLIGRAFRSREVQTAIGRMPYLIKEGPNQQPLIGTRAGEFAVPEISAIVLDHMRKLAERATGDPVTRAVITVPASFNEAQRSATASAGAIAGLTVIRVLNEPTAAALAYGHTRHLQRTIAVYDFGGGTFDITVLRLDDNVYEVLGTAGDTFLGGDDIDERVVDILVESFLSQHRIDLRQNEIAMMRLRAVAEQTKIELSRRSRAIIKVDEIAYGPGGKPLNLQQELSRDQLVANVVDVIDRTFPVCDEALQIAGLRTPEIEDVVLVGGTTKMPYVRDRVAAYFGRAPRADINPEEAVAVGAGLQAAALERLLLKRPSVRMTGQVPLLRREDTDTGTDTETATATRTNTATDEVTHSDALSSMSGTTNPQHMAIDEDTGITLESTGVPLPPDEVSEVTRLAPDPRKQTTRLGGVSTRPPAPRVGDRPAQRGESIDRIDANAAAERVPGIPGVPLGRVTRPGPGAPPPTPGPRTSMGVVPATPPTTPPPRSSAPPPPPLQPNPSAAIVPRSEFDNVPTRPADEGAQKLIAATASSQPVGPGRAPPPPRPPPMPVAPPEAPTLFIDVEEPAAASTAKGLPPMPGTLPSTLAGYSGGPVADDPSAGSTARGVPPPGATMPPAFAMPAPTVLDVTPRAFGISTVAGYCEELIRRNARVPTEMKKVFTTSHDLQRMVRIRICQGESRRLDDNTVIGDLVLDNLDPRPRGETTIEVTFAIDASGILNVRARDARSGREQQASLDIVGAQSQAEVEASRNRLQQMRR
jgi:molecular chaperone DnaK